MIEPLEEVIGVRRDKFLKRYYMCAVWLTPDIS